MSRFAALKAAPVAATPTPDAEPIHAAKPAVAARADKRMIGGHFSPAVQKALRQLALDEGTTVQALIGEAFDLLMRDRGKHPFGER